MYVCLCLCLYFLWSGQGFVNVHSVCVCTYVPLCLCRYMCKIDLGSGLMLPVIIGWNKPIQNSVCIYFVQYISLSMPYSHRSLFAIFSNWVIYNLKIFYWLRQPFPNNAFVARGKRRMSNQSASHTWAGKASLCPGFPATLPCHLWEDLVPLAFPVPPSLALQGGCGISAPLFTTGNQTGVRLGVTYNTGPGQAGRTSSPASYCCAGPVLVWSSSSPLIYLPRWYIFLLDYPSSDGFF